MESDLENAYQREYAFVKFLIALNNLYKSRGAHALLHEDLEELQKFFMRWDLRSKEPIRLL